MLPKIVWPTVVALLLLVWTDPAAATELIFDTQDFAPLNYEVNGVVSGPGADVIRRICADMKITCPMRLLPWRRAQQEVFEGKAHGIFLVGWNAERARWLSFSPPLLNSEYGFFVRDDNPLRFTQNSDVKGYLVGVYGPSNTATSLEKIKADLGGDLTIDMTPDDESAFRKASLGRVKAVFSNRDVGYDLIKKLGITNLRYTGRQQALKYYIAFSQKFADKKLVDQFNETFRTLHKQGVIQEILGRYKMEAVALE
ncbi:MAG: ABC transporter substrate-binding protein [Candidatus Rokuibacteriota bacterium]|nr:MAG: ABC transporter substrate-binding protein [Candidatus Rokubacteria bacterium]